MLVENIAPPPRIYLDRVSAEGSAFDLFKIKWDDDSSLRNDDDLIDIVLMHGLTGDPFATWGIKLDGPSIVGTCWIADLARELRGKGVVWTAGYKAPLMSNTSTPQSIYGEGREALSALARSGLGRRKIVFVAHSLGGILVKAALFSALSTQKEIEQSVLLNTFGVIFIGTPHSGSELTRWRRAIPLVAKMAATGMGSLVMGLLGAYILAGTAISFSLFNSDWKVTVSSLVTTIAVPLLAFFITALLRPSAHILSLDPQNPALYDLTDDYRHVVATREFPTRAFFERRPIWRLFTVVPRASADPGVTDCRPVGIDSDHIAMCKGNYAVPIRHAIGELVSNARKGKETAVFEGRLYLEKCGETQRKKIELLMIGYPKQFAKRFSDLNVDRKGAEQVLRTHLRSILGNGIFQPTSLDIGLAETSEFDIDIFVWCMWQERSAMKARQKLRVRAVTAMDRWPEDFNRPRPSLIPFYRAMRTIEHIYRADLTDFTSETEFELLLRLVRHGNTVLEESSQIVFGQINGHNWVLDGDAGTRRLLLRMECAISAMDVACRYVDAQTRDRHEDAEQHRAQLIQLRQHFVSALTEFKSKLDSN
jgi:hypothetical protein